MKEGTQYTAAKQSGTPHGRTDGKEER